MAEQKSFKERVKETVIYNAYSYKKYYTDYEYLLCSKAFIKNEYYIVAAYEDNYLHLTGLHTKLDATTFFEKCYKGTLDERDFDFLKNGQNESEVNMSKAKKLDLVLRKKTGELKFSEILLGDEKQLAEYKESLKEVLSDDLLKSMEEIEHY